MSDKTNPQLLYDAVLRDAAMRLFLGEDIATADAEILAIADFDVSSMENRPFVEFIHWVNARPAFINIWRGDPESERKHYVRFMEGIDACRTAYAASAYHLGRLREIEGAVHDILSRFDFSKSIARGSVAAIGRMRRCDFEYHAFVMAYRSSLDRLAWGLSTYFKEQSSSFNGLNKNLPNFHPTSVAKAVASASSRHIANFEFVIGNERGRSIRDRMAHREAIQAGSINIGAFGHRIIGGGEKLGLSNFTDPRRLADVLHERLAQLHDCIQDILATFRSAVIEYESKQTAG